MTEDIGLLERERLLTAKDVQALTGIKSRVTLWRKSNDTQDAFPTAYRDGSHYTRWKQSEVLDWIKSLRQEPRPQQ